MLQDERVVAREAHQLQQGLGGCVCECEGDQHPGGRVERAAHAHDCSSGACATARACHGALGARHLLVSKRLDKRAPGVTQRQEAAQRRQPHVPATGVEGVRGGARGAASQRHTAGSGRAWQQRRRTQCAPGHPEHLQPKLPCGDEVEVDALQRAGGGTTCAHAAAGRDRRTASINAASSKGRSQLVR